MKQTFLSFLICAWGIYLADDAMAARRDLFRGTAREAGKIVYFEDHDVQFDDQGIVLEATTTYNNPEGKILAILTSDFRNSLSLPDHVFKDERTMTQYGIRREAGKVILFSKDRGKIETSKVLDDKGDIDRLQVGCQGFNYYLKGRTNFLKSIRSQPVLFMVPGDLTTYKFVLEYLGETQDQVVDFKVKIENWFFRAFAPELEFKYDKKIDRIVWYKGISNIKNNDGQVMNVTIDYKY
jgi:hypothetical protein